MNPGRLAIVLALGWVALTGGFSLLNLALGAAIAGLAMFLLRHRLARPLSFRRMAAVLALSLLFVQQLMLSAVAVARLALTPNLASRLAPAIVAFPLSARSDAEIALLANLITLTPGTLSLDVSPDRSKLYIHVLVLRGRDSLIAEIADGFEKKVINVFR